MKEGQENIPGEALDDKKKCAQLRRQFWLIEYLSLIWKAARKAGSPHWEQDISDTGKCEMPISNTPPLF